MSKEPAATFPANISVARVQAPNYESYRVNSFGTGRYSIVTTREVETEDDFKRLSKLPQIAGIAPLNRILLPTNLDSIKALPEASARLKADILLIYTFDTSFHAGEQIYAPLNAISLGFLKNGSSPHQVGEKSNDCHRVTENTEVLSACRYTAPAKDANDVV